MKSFRHMAITVAAAMTVAGAAHASELLQNGSFEGPNLDPGVYDYPGQAIAGPLLPATVDSWTYTWSALVDATGSSAWYGGSAPAGQDGFQFAALQGTSTLSQTFTMQGTSLDVSWLSAGRPYFGGYNGDQTYMVTLGGQNSQVYTTTSGQAFTQEFAHFNGLTSGQTYTLSFVGLDTFPGRTTADETAFIDKVSAVAGVPEPSSWALMLLGVGGLGGALRSKRRTVAVTA